MLQGTMRGKEGYPGYEEGRYEKESCTQFISVNVCIVRRWILFGSCYLG